MIKEPFLLQPVLMEKIWGGRRLATVIGKTLPPGKIGESWEASTHRNGVSTIASGSLKNLKLDRAIAMHSKEMLGERIVGRGYDALPVLVKFIAASDKLSVQVHPDDNYAKMNENDHGKTEMWYILYTEPNSQLIYGLKEGTTREMLGSAIELNEAEKYLRYVDISVGDVLFVPAGTVHAILGGVVLLEIQQSSDSTYRLYDWGRLGFDGKPRSLHIKKALDVINYDYNGDVKKAKGKKTRYGDVSILAESQYFNVKRYRIKKEFNFREKPEDRFNIFIIIRGSGRMQWGKRASGSPLSEGKLGYLPYKKGDTFFIPPGCYNLQVLPDRESEFIDVFLD